MSAPEMAAAFLCRKTLLAGGYQINDFPFISWGGLIPMAESTVGATSMFLGEALLIF